MQKFQFVKIDSILAKFQRDFKGLDINEDDAIEWIGEALGFMKIVSASEEAIAFIEVKNYHASIPPGLHYITQIARNNDWEKPEDTNSCASNTIAQIETEINCCDEQPKHLSNEQVSVTWNEEQSQYVVELNLPLSFQNWIGSTYKKTKYTPVRLANHSFLNTLVCKEKDMEDVYCRDCDDRDEYTIVQDQLRFNFKSGLIALAYIRQMIDSETGYPMIPDDESARAAITYYLGWKVKETEAWNHREGAMQLAQIAEQHWLKYIKQFKNKAKMPTGVDQYQNLMEQSNYLIPNHNRYYGFFGKLGTAENRTFNGPRKITNYAR
ncbi:hypothetical protein BOX09_gp29 [Flavobacterium phage Fpv1]|uniref:Uncharacterized protein n=2 Tax=Fipvunavirus Fpv1 TaxID=2560475 RepID=A0A1B0WKW1_9CAUD|nr:hypothetical protein BOW81_gp29 [Flavobacterium phage Fpv20]YP_009322031.1 hypothetical protein BOX09_gp29 [Flavobacterium phage Fpv1]YP_009323620.1 hypothetical protein BOW82_gp29 [Flavobacterium phage Fpv2]ALN97275.1 hypothetical protein [Flavobacterium phage FpV21]QCW20314.1 hypothetical protein [Flavobacterium phage FPSV-F12]QCW20687.1 hypothetical protein [Flavobacterium phage FPSV-S29]ANB40271.1 hypothetical protein [Flavobacterium phage Fpv1]ANB40351.1 hypothetical protein [Flavoba